MVGERPLVTPLAGPPFGKPAEYGNDALGGLLEGFLSGNNRPLRRDEQNERLKEQCFYVAALVPVVSGIVDAHAQKLILASRSRGYVAREDLLITGTGQFFEVRPPILGFRGSQK